MATKPDIRFTIDVNGLPRRVMSVIDLKQKGLLITLRGGAYVLKPNIDRTKALSADETEALRIDNYYCSVHPSNESVNNLSTIKVSRILPDGTCDTAVSYTTAIKLKNGFAAAFARRCGDFTPPEYDASKSKAKSSVSLGTLDLGFTLTFMILVSDVDREFIWPMNVSRDFCFYQKKFQTCRLIMLYSFLNLPPNADSSSAVSQCIPDSPPVDGMTEMESALLFYNHRVKFRRDLIAFVESAFKDSPSVKDDLVFLKFTEYFREARTDTEEFRSYLERIRHSSKTGFYVTPYC